MWALSELIHVNCWPCVYWFMDVVCCNYCQKFITALGSLLSFLLLPFSLSSLLQNTISSTFSSAYNYSFFSSSLLLWANVTIVPSLTHQWFPLWTSLSLYVTHSVVSDSLQPRGLLPTSLLGPWDFSGQNNGVGCHFLLRGFCWPRDQT